MADWKKARLKAIRDFGLLTTLAALTACSSMRIRSPIAPVAGPPPTFVLTTSDVRGSRLIDVRDGIAKPAAFRAVIDMVTQRYSVDVKDQEAGFVMSPWQASFMRDGAPDLRYRTRVMIRFLGDDWKQVSIRVQANWQRTGDEWDIGYDKHLLDEVGNDLQSRIGKKP